MLERLIGLSLQYRGVVLALTLLLGFTGVWSFQRLPLDAYPDTTPTQVMVNAVAPALGPEEIERQITARLEESLGGLPGLVEIRSISKFGFCQIVTVFDDDTDVYLARQLVSERMQSASLPDGIDTPTLGPPSTGLGEVFQYLVTSDSMSLRDLRTLHHWVIRPQMLQVPGVAESNTWGGFEKEFHIVFEPQLLIENRLTLEDIARAVRANNKNVGGGIVNQGGEGRVVQGVGLVESIEDIEEIVVATRNGRPLRIKDVSRVTEGHVQRLGASTAEGEGEAILGLGFMLMGENSHEVTKALAQRLEEVGSTLPAGVKLTPVYNRTDLIDSVLKTVRKNLLEGALLVIAILFIFLGNLRAGLIVALAIPLSMLFAFNAMLQFGIAGSLMSLGAIDFGLVVDSSVIMVENASHRLATDKTGRSVREIVHEAALEVRRPTLFGELIITIVYLPILALEGVEGRLFRPMALTVIFALAGSMVLSLTLMPALASMVLRRPKRSKKEKKTNLANRFVSLIYRPILRVVIGQRWLVIALAIAVIGTAVNFGLRLGTEFVPRLREQAIVINTVRLAGVSLEESVRYGTQIEKKLKAEFPDEIEHIWTRTGTAEVATDPMGIEVSDVFITLSPREEWRKATTQDELMEAMSVSLENLPGMRAIYTQPIEMRMNEMVAGIRADLGLKLFGKDLDVLVEKAAEIEEIIAGVEGAEDVSAEQVTGQPTLRFTPNKKMLARYGVSKADVLQVVEVLGDMHVGELTETNATGSDGAENNGASELSVQARFDIGLRLPQRYRDNPDLLKELLFTAPDGTRVRLGELLFIDVVEGPSTITREWGQRRIAVQANVRGRDIGSFVRDVQEAVATVDLPPGYYIRYGGQFEHLERAQLRLMIVVPMAIALVFMLLYLTFGGVRDALIVFTGVPFAAVGGVFALWIRDLPFSISAAVGFIAVSGVAVLGQLVLVSAIKAIDASSTPPADQNKDGEGHEDAAERPEENPRFMARERLFAAIETASLTRLRPVLMTGLVAALGFVPMALNTGLGAEVQRPLATVVIGGVISSLLATLVVLPALYAALAKRTLRTDTEGQRSHVPS